MEGPGFQSGANYGCLRDEQPAAIPPHLRSHGKCYASPARRSQKLLTYASYVSAVAEGTFLISIGLDRETSLCNIGAGDAARFATWEGVKGGA